MKPHIVFTVINDLHYDQRMQRICTSLSNAGYRVTLIGRVIEKVKPLPERNYRQIRLTLFFNKGKLFYFFYNLRLLWHLLTHRYDIYGATDLDTLVPNFIAAKIKRKPHVYDAHEYFTQLPEIINRPVVKWVWKTVERIIVPRTRYAYTINQSYADMFRYEYGTFFEIIRNAAVLRDETISKKNGQEKYILYQGAVNVGRGVEEMIEAMLFIENCKLYICGKGDVFDDCVNLVSKFGLENKVRFFGFIQPDQLRQITLNATLGFTFFSREGESYYYSLANRFFDYFHAGVPQLCVNFPEYKRINDEFEVAVILEDINPLYIAAKVNELLSNEEYYERLRQNCLEARKVVNWQMEEKKLVAFYDRIAL
ncbi:MAG: glycosyltransferase [Sphingobacteriales bacterium]|nr:MAG: glycosyltransferase [Sphingobacteriales bacterium]